MARRRNKHQPDEDVVVEETVVEGVRHDGPWDSAERSPVADDPTYVDLGPLIVHARPGINVQMPTDGNGEDIGSVVLVTDDAALEVRAFAATRSGGLWDEVRDDLILEVERLGGQCDQVDGPFGPELRVRVPVELPDGEQGFQPSRIVGVEGPFGPELRIKVPVELPDGEQGFQPSRIVGIEGPRWLLRATFLGEAGLNPSDEGLLVDALRDVIVVRGAEPRLLREALLLTPPSTDTVVLDEE